MFHSGGLSAPTPPNLAPGHNSPQASYTMQGYSLPTHQALPHGFPSISQLTQVKKSLSQKSTGWINIDINDGSVTFSVPVLLSSLWTCAFSAQIFQNYLLWIEIWVLHPRLLQASVPGGMSGHHHSAGHGPHVMLHYAPPQQGSGSNPQHGPQPQQGAPQHFYIGPPQGKTQTTTDFYIEIIHCKLWNLKFVLRTQNRIQENRKNVMCVLSSSCSGSGPSHSAAVLPPICQLKRPPHGMDSCSVDHSHLST